MCETIENSSMFTLTLQVLRSEVFKCNRIEHVVGKGKDLFNFDMGLIVMTRSGLSSIFKTTFRDLVVCSWCVVDITYQASPKKDNW